MRRPRSLIPSKRPRLRAVAAVAAILVTLGVTDDGYTTKKEDGGTAATAAPVVEPPGEYASCVGPLTPPYTKWVAIKADGDNDAELELTVTVESRTQGYNPGALPRQQPVPAGYCMAIKLKPEVNAYIVALVTSKKRSNVITCIVLSSVHLTPVRDDKSGKDVARCPIDV